MEKNIIRRISWIALAVLMAGLAACGAKSKGGNIDEPPAFGEIETKINNSEETGGQERPGGSQQTEAPETPDEGKKAIPAISLKEQEYETEVVRLVETHGDYASAKKMERMETERAVYCFEPALSLQEREGCVRATETLLGNLDGTVLPKPKIALYLPETYHGTYMDNGVLYIPPQDWESADYAAKVLLLALGQWGNYGLAYGYANYLCGEAGWGHDKTEGFLPAAKGALYDMNLLCFQEGYADEEDRAALKNNACYFADIYLKEHSKEDLQQVIAASGTLEGCDKANQALSDFYAENQVEYEPASLLYRFAGMSFDFIAFSKYATFHMRKDWVDAYQDFVFISIPDNFLRGDYSIVKEVFEECLLQMREFRELFALEIYDNNLPVIFKTGNHKSYYYPHAHKIELITFDHMMHEYIHSLVSVHSRQEFWAKEGFVEYFESKYNIYGNWASSQYFNNFQTIVEEYDEKRVKYYTYLLEYLNVLQRSINVMSDFWELCNVYVYSRDIKDPNYDPGNYWAGTSFVGFLVKEYGEENVIRYVCAEDGNYQDLGKTYQELVMDWNTYIEENYTQYSKYYEK